MIFSVGLGDLGVVLAAELLGGGADHVREGAVGVESRGAFEVGVGDPDRGVIEDRAVAPLALPERDCGSLQFLLSDVLTDRDQSGEREREEQQAQRREELVVPLSRDHDPEPEGHAQHRHPRGTAPPPTTIVAQSSTTTPSTAGKNSSLTFSGPSGIQPCHSELA
jgi:hypothetical protein